MVAMKASQHVCWYDMADMRAAPYNTEVEGAECLVGSHAVLYVLCRQDDIPHCLLVLCCVGLRGITAIAMSCVTACGQHRD